MARRDFAAAMRQNLFALAMSVGAIAATPRMSAGLSGSARSAASWSHTISSADCARAGRDALANAAARLAAKASRVPRDLRADRSLMSGRLRWRGERGNQMPGWQDEPRPSPAPLFPALAACKFHGAQLERAPLQSAIHFLS